jgi:hypothetical protein
MSSRFTVDTTYLKIRDVFAFNRDTGNVISSDSVPVIGLNGHIDWKSSLEFISSISVPTLNTTVLGILEMIQPGLSSLSTMYFSTMDASIKSTVGGLGSLPNGNDYVSTSKMLYNIDRLSGDYYYISSTNLYDCINHLGNLINIGPLLHVPGTQSNFDARGYVSTLHPGEYKIYHSSLQLKGENAINIGMNNIAVVDTGIIDIQGYAPHIVNSSKMRIDINTNLTISHLTSVQRTFSTFLTNHLQNLPIGTPVVTTYTGTSLYIPSMSFLINAPELDTSIQDLYLKHSTDSETAGILNTLIPNTGGIHITLDNTD